jgi:hypothetical protein
LEAPQQKIFTQMKIKSQAISLVKKIIVVVLATCKAVGYKPTRTANRRSTNIKTDLLSIPRCTQANKLPTHWKSNHCTEKAKNQRWGDDWIFG